jgi:hypothetical protein
MKKICSIGVLLFCAVFVLRAQETRGFSLGAGLEGNMNTLSAVASGASLSLVFNLNQSLGLGFKGTVSYNFDRILTVEPGALFRWYAIPMGEGAALFFQADLGVSLIIDDGSLFPAPMESLSAGIRFSMGSLVIEPAVRAGYPFIWGAGLTLGYRFGTSAPAALPQEDIQPAESQNTVLRR